MLLGLAAASCIGLQTYWASRDAPVGSDGGGTADAFRSSAQEDYTHVDEVPVAEVVNQSAVVRGSLSDDGQRLASVPPSASLAQMLKDLVLTGASGLTDAESASLVESLDQQERAFGAESADSQWAYSAEARILGSISELTNLPLMTLEVDCKTSTCRLQVAERAGRHDFFARLGIRARWVLSRVDQQGTRISIGYVQPYGIDPVGAQH
jgi:hypothetical protein